jgi:demethylmenaquinone methyltransferase/2-methoxy-6-polyprenyl-1,4-benzoquinol methylase
LLASGARARFRRVTVSEQDTARAAARGEREKAAYVRRMFSAIAPRYDLLNHLLSLNIDRAWRRRAVAALGIDRNPAGRYLDLCAGTLDSSAAIAAAPHFSGIVVGTDFAEGMLRAARRKRLGRSIAPVVADALQLPLGDATCAGALVAFGVRNVADLDAALREAWRVLEPGARLVILEFSTPPNRIVRGAYHAYFHHVLPRVGALVSGHASAYSYLPASVAGFPSPGDLAARMREAGFQDVQWSLLTFGVAALHVGRR